MDFSLTDEQSLLLDSLAEVVKEHGSEDYIRQCDEAGERPAELIAALHEAGFDMLGVPEEYGGTMVDTFTLMLYHEEFARLCSGAYACECSALAMADMIKFGSPEQIQDCVDAIGQLKTPFCLGFSEPGAGSDESAIATTFERRDGKVVINGQKTFISRADNANFMLCCARDPQATDPRKAFSTWWVPMDAEGITISPIPKVGWKSIHSCDVYLDNVVVEESALVGKEGNGFINVMKNFEIERLVMAATALGEAEAAYEDACKHANERVQFGKTIGSFQLVQKKITDMAIKIRNMKHQVYYAAWLEDQGKPVNTAAAMAKYYCSQASHEVINDAMQILGGLGYSEELRIQRLWRNNRICGIGGGTDEIMIHVAGRALLKEAKKATQ